PYLSKCTDAMVYPTSDSEIKRLVGPKYIAIRLKETRSKIRVVEGVTAITSTDQRTSKRTVKHSPRVNHAKVSRVGCSAKWSRTNKQRELPDLHSARVEYWLCV